MVMNIKMIKGNYKAIVLFLPNKNLTEKYSFNDNKKVFEMKFEID